MPASYTHQSVALEAARMSGLSPVPAYLAGCEGPDPLFFSFMNPSPAAAPRAGTAMHRTRTGDFLLALADQAVSPVQQLYLFGFLTHYAADTVFHPFVYAHSLTRDGQVSSNLHCTLEHAYELRRFRLDGHASGLPVQMWGQAHLTPEECGQICKAFAGAAQKVYPELSLTESRLRRAMRDCVSVCRALASGKGQKYRSLTALPFGIGALAKAHMIPPQLPEEDLFNLAHAQWTSPWDPGPRTESMDDLYAPACRRALAFIQGAQAYLSGDSRENFFHLLGDMSYDSGLPWQMTMPAEEAVRAKSGG